MRRLVCLMAALAMILCLGAPARANLFTDDAENYGNAGRYIVKFAGFDYLYNGTHEQFMQGGVTLATESDLISEGSVVTGFNISGLMYFTTISNGNGYWVEQYPPLHTASNTGLYFSVVRDVYVAESIGSIPDPTDAKVYFTGGAMDWYYAENGYLTDLSNLIYMEGVGLVDKNTGAVFDLASYGDPYVTFNLATAGSDYSGYANANLDTVENIKGDYTFYAYTDNPLFNSNVPEFGLMDAMLQGTMLWNSEYNRYSVNDPMKVMVPTPEPGSLALMGLGLLLAVMCMRRRGIELV